MKSWHVTYFYLATGMNGVADERDYGVVLAETAEAACRAIALSICDKSKNYDAVDWVISCLSAKEINPEVAHMFVRLSTGAVLDRRELGTVLAALRLWQRYTPDIRHFFAENDIATDSGQFEPLSNEEIDALCEELKV